MSQAKLTRVDALEQLKAAVATFVDDAKTALGSVEMETRRAIDQLQRERPYYWHQQIKIGRDEFAEAKASLARKRLQKNDSYIPDTSEEEKAIRLAKARIENAEQKLEAIKAWSRRIEQAWNDYQGPSGQLADEVGGSPPRAIAELNRLIRAVDAYLQVQAPAAPLEAGDESFREAPSMARPVEDAAEEPAPKSESDESDDADKKEP
jgi:hypothetical protein